jgi:hypothetical protein
MGKDIEIPRGLQEVPSETINQFTGVAANREALGLPNSSSRMALNIAAAGVGAAGLRGIGEGAVILKRRADFSKLRPTQILERFRSERSQTGRTTVADDALENILEREAVDEPIMPMERATLREGKAKMEAAETSFRTGRPDFADIPEPDTSRFDADFDAMMARLDKNEALFDDIPFDPPRIADMPNPVFREQAEDIFQRMQMASRVETEAPATEKRFAQFVREEGGIADPQGQLRERGVTAQQRPGLIRKAGQTYDQLRQKAFNAGYFPEKQSAADITDKEIADLVAADIRGEAPAVRITAPAGRELTQFQKQGFTPAMTVEQIAQKLEREAAFVESLRYYEAVQPEALQRQKLANEEYSLQEIEELDAALNELREGNRSFIVENNGRIEERSLKELIEEIDKDDAIIKAIDTCII